MAELRGTLIHPSTGRGTASTPAQVPLYSLLSRGTSQSASTLGGNEGGRFGTSPALCVPITSSTSCHQAVFVDQAADPSLSSDAVQVEVDRLG